MHGLGGTSESGGRLDKRAKSHHDALWRAWYNGLQTITIPSVAIPAYSMTTLHHIQQQTETPPIAETTTSTTSTPSSAVLQSLSGKTVNLGCFTMFHQVPTGFIRGDGSF